MKSIKTRVFLSDHGAADDDQKTVNTHGMAVLKISRDKKTVANSGQYHESILSIQVQS
jgi:hypothetical protein